MQKAVRLHGFVIGVVCLALIEGATARAQVDQLLIHSARMGDYAAVLRLVAAGANPNVQDSTGTTALMEAVMHGHLSIVLYLLTNGADPNIQGGTGMTALAYAASKGNRTMVSHLLTNGADPNI